MTDRTRKGLIVGAAVAAVALTGGAIAAATSYIDDDGAPDNPAEDIAEGPDQPITGPDRAIAESAALDYLGEGRVTATEIEDEESYYEVEVTLDDGSEVDVQLDEEFNVVGTD